MEKTTYFITNPRRYSELNMPEGFLADDPACHALFYYATMLRRHIDEYNDPIQYEGTYVQEPNLAMARNLFLVCALFYGVQPEKMVKFWKNVDMQFMTMKGKQIPVVFKFNQLPEVKTQ